MSIQHRPEEAVINTKDLCKNFGSLPAIKNLTLKVRAGESYGLIGPNGSGKTTLIRMLMGLIKPTSGRASVLGRQPGQRLALQKVGYMSQATALYQDLTVEENLFFFGRIYGESSKARVRELLAFVNLENRARSLVRTLSGGMRQRLSLACSLVHKPSLLFLDEPTVGIDPQLRVEFWKHFRQLNSEGTTIVISSHIMDEAERCDRLGFLREGVLLAEGTPAELKAKSGKTNLEEAFLYFAGKNVIARDAVPKQSREGYH